MNIDEQIRPEETMGAPGADSAMRAIVQDHFGEAKDVLRVGQIDRPTPGDDEVLVRVHAAGVDRGTWHLVAGLPYLIRLAGFGVRTPKNPVPGLDLSGTVESIGSNVTGFAPGDEVFGIGNGSFAEYATAPAAKLAIKPERLSFEEAAAVAVSGLTALQAVRDQGDVQPGQKVLIVGASGGVGTFAVQIAKAFGAEVTGVASAAKVDLVSGLGADHVIDYSATDFAEGSVRYDVILDIGGNRTISDLRRVLSRDGRLVIVGGENGGRWIGGVDRQLRAILLSPFVGQKLGTFISSENGGDLVELSELIEAEKVTPLIDRTFPLSEAASAVSHVENGKARGKVVIVT